MKKNDLSPSSAYVLISALVALAPLGDQGEWAALISRAANARVLYMQSRDEAPQPTSGETLAVVDDSGDDDGEDDPEEA